MIVVGVADQQQVEPPEIQRTQRRQDDTFAAVEVAEARPGVVQQAVLAGPHQNRQALADIQDPDVGLPVLGSLRRYQQRGQQQRQPRQAQRHTGRQQQQRGPQRRQRPDPPRQLAGQPGGQAAGDQAEQREEQLQCPAGQPQQALAEQRHRQQQRTEQRQRHHHQPYPGHGEQIGQGPAAADRQPEDQHHRQQADRRGPLRTCQPAPPAPGTQPPGKGQRKHGDRRERQPEARLQGRQRLQQQHHQQGRQQWPGSAQVTKAQAPQQHQGNHHAGPAHRHLEPGQQAIDQRAAQGQRAGARQPRQTLRPGTEPGQQRHQAIEETGQQGDVLPGDDHQVHGAGVLQQTPVLRRQAGTIAEHQCGDAALPSPGGHRQQALAQGVAPAAQATGRGQALTRLDRPRGADTLGQQPGFVIETLRIDQAMGTLEIDCQTPTLAGQHLWPAIPGQAHPGGQFGTP